MTWKLAGFFARCEGVWPSSRADRLWERVGSWGRQRGCGEGWGAGLEGILQSGGFQSSAIILSTFTEVMGHHNGGAHLTGHTCSALLTTYVAGRSQHPATPPLAPVPSLVIKHPEGTASLYFRGSAFCVWGGPAASTTRPPH